MPYAENVASAPHGGPAPATGYEPLELGAEDEADNSSAAQNGSTEFQTRDEFLLDARRLAEVQPADPADIRHRPIAPVAPPQADIGTQSRLPAGQEPPVRQASTGTLFERMANLTGRRKVSEEAEEGEDSGAVNIPRFLGRQNNQ